MVWWPIVGAALLATTPPVPPTPPVPSSVPPSTAAPVPGGSVPASSVPTGGGDPLGCEALVFDPSSELDLATTTQAATLTAETLGADVHVRAEPNLDGGLDARMAQLEAQCPGWSFEGVRQLDLVVVMYSSTEREASVFYGPAQAYLLEFRWEHAVDEMGPHFAAGDYTAGIVAGLAALRQDPPVTYQPTYSPTQYDDSDADGTGSGGVSPVLWLGLAAVVVIALVRVGQFLKTGEWENGDDDHDDSRRGWTSSRRSSSWGSSSRSRRSSSSSRSSARRSSRRSGGGTKKW